MADEENGSGAQAIIEAARQTAKPYVVADVDKPHVLVIPEGAELVEVDLDAWRQHPSRPTGTVKPATVKALTDYVARHKDDRLSVWVHPSSGRIVAVLDDHATEPGWGQHRADLTLAHTPEWDYWAKTDGHWLGQAEFAEHIEGGLMEIIRPAAADVLELAQHFHATKDASFRSSQRLADGQTQFKYDESVTASAGQSGQLEIPKSLTLLIAPFIGEEGREVAARFQYRINGGALKLRYVLERPHLVIREALDKVEKTLGETFPGVVYSGEPSPA